MGTAVGVGNISWSNATNNYSESVDLASTNNAIKTNVSEKTNVTTWYWISIPPVYAGRYNGTVYITGVKNGENP
jgi:hypothetical protein